MCSKNTPYLFLNLYEIVIPGSWLGYKETQRCMYGRLVFNKNNSQLQDYEHLVQ